MRFEKLSKARRLWCLMLICTVTAIAASSCGDGLPARDSANFEEAVTRFYVGLAAVQVGNDQRAAVELEKASVLAPGEPAVWNNLGVLRLRQKDIENAASALGEASDLAPGNSKIFFNLAILAQQKNDTAGFVSILQKVRELDPNDLRPLYLLAVEHERQQNDAEALKAFEKILKQEPTNLAALIESARIRANTGDKEGLANDLALLDRLHQAWPDAAVEQFSKLKKTPIEKSATEIAFLRNVLLRLPVFRASMDKIKPSDTAIGDLISVPLKLETPKFGPAEPDREIEFAAEAVSQEQSAGVKIVFLEGDKIAIAFSDKSGTKIGEALLPFTFSDPDHLAVLDFDYDYKNDIALANESGFKLFKQGQGAAFSDVTADTKVSDTVSGGSYNGGWPLDFDNDGDLDLVLAPTDGELIVLRNNGNGTFETLHPFKNAVGVNDLESADLDEDGDSDVALLLQDNTIQVFKNERGDIFERTEGIIQKNVGAMSIGDANSDGILDIISVLNDGKVEIDTLATSKASDSSKVEFPRCSSNCSLVTGDFDNNGALDLIFSNESGSKISIGVENSEAIPLLDIGAVVSDTADLNKDGLLDLVGIDSENRAVSLTTSSKKNYSWQIVKPRSAKTEGDQRVNTFGIGGEIEARAGLAVQKQLIRTPQVHFGLGNATQADVLRIVWQNGYVQAEFDMKTDQVVAAEQRLKGSCPYLFTWNGTKFVHVKDAPPWSPALGLKINAQDTYGILQTEEWFKIPGDKLKPRDGFYELRITGEYWEAYYIDHYRLLAVDHPEDTEVFTDERFAIPLPPLKVFTTNKPRPFKSAIDHNGKNVASIVATLDEKYLDDIERGKYQGVAKDHFVELELPDNAPRNKKLWIIADGWVHPTDASINVQRGQDVARPPKSLSIEVQEKNGEWKTVKENLGFPAGKMKSVLLDIEDIFDSQQVGRKLRLRTEMEIFWDKLAWAEAGNGEDNQTKELDLDAAELRFRGFSVINKADDSSPEIPDYDQILTTGQRWRDLEGYYTKYGDITPLLAKTDDRFVLSNAGDELLLKFPALPEVKEGYRRDFVIIGNGWIKDGDLNSVFSKTVLPLPTQASNDYTKPPTTLEDDPVYKRNSRDWIDFHTRYVAPDSFRNALRGN